MKCLDLSHYELKSKSMDQLEIDIHQCNSECLCIYLSEKWEQKKPYFPGKHYQIIKQFRTISQSNNRSYIIDCLQSASLGITNHSYSASNKRSFHCKFGLSILVLPKSTLVTLLHTLLHCSLAASSVKFSYSQRCYSLNLVCSLTIPDGKGKFFQK